QRLGLALQVLELPLGARERRLCDRDVVPRALDRMLRMSLLVFVLGAGEIRLRLCEFPLPAGQLVARRCRSVPSPRLLLRIESEELVDRLCPRAKQRHVGIALPKLCNARGELGVATAQVA